MRKKRWLSVVAATGLLGGCGGGGVNSTPNSPPVAPNTSLDDLRRSQTFSANSAKSALAFDLTSRTTISGSALNDALTISYDAATKGYTVAASGRGQTFLPADVQPSPAAGQVTYQKTNATGRDLLTLVRVPYTGTVATQYVGLGYWQQNVVTGNRQDTLFNAFTYGIETPASATPRTGNGSFRVDVFGLSTTPGFEPRTFQGQGTFTTDFLAGLFSTNTLLTETGLISGNGIIGGGIELIGAGHLSGTDGSFSGNVLYGGVNVKVAGTMAGRFYGPAAQELGASFTAGNSDGSTVTGAMTGQRDAAGPTANLRLTNLVESQIFYPQVALLTVTSIDGQAGIQVGTRTMTGGLTDLANGSFNFGPGTSLLPSGEFTPSSVVTSSDPNFTAYEKTFDGQPVRLELYKPGSGNTELALTYSSFGRWSSASENGVVNDTYKVFFAYGLETPAGLLSARTGSARYSGVVYGAGVNQQTEATYTLTGTSRFDVDFSNQRFSGALALRGASTNAAAIDFGSYDFAGDLALSTRQSTAALSQNGINSGELTSTFFGPDGEEIGGPFTLAVAPGNSGAGTSIVGATIARRQ